ncbi:MAG: hypothetical protein OEZ22_07485 [Spirochaetia bacterium]|nr:hypothetical protein [Spirochaetia bacterium]
MNQYYNNIIYFLNFLRKQISVFILLSRKHIVKNILSSFGLFLTLIILIFSLGLIRPIKNHIESKLEESLPSKVIRLQAEQKEEKSLIFSLFGNPQGVNMGISTKEIREIKKWDHVENVFYTQMFQQPAMVAVEHNALQGIAFQMDMIFQGIDETLVKSHLLCMKDFKPDARKLPNGGTISVIPVVVPEKYAEILYSYGLIIPRMPLIKKENLIGLELPVKIGRSVVMRNAEVKENIIAKVCGFIPEDYVTAAGIPLEWVQWKHQQWKMTNAVNSYDQVFVKVSHPKYIEEIKEKALKMNLIAPVKKDEYNMLYKKIEQFDYLFMALSFILLLITLISLFNSFSLIAATNKYEFGLCMVFGASPFFIWVIMFFEGALWGFIYSFLSFELAELLYNYLREIFLSIPLISEVTANQKGLMISASEKTYLTLSAILLAGFFSFLPAVLLTAKKTISLIKKD